MPPKTDKVAEKVENKYPTIKHELCLVDKDQGLTADRAKELLGWETEGPEDKWGDDYFGTDVNGNKFRVKHNTKNRPWTRSWSLTLAQDMVSKQWQLNGEAWIFGQSGQALSCQHRGIGLIFAQQLREKQKEHWDEVWGEDKPVVIDALLMFGIAETPEVLRTLDNVKPRSLADVLFSNPDNFKKLKGAKRHQAVKVAESAIKTLWTRTGRYKNVYDGRRTHSEAIEFLADHPHVVGAVEHIVTEVSNPNSVLTKYVSAGWAAAMLYLMASSKSDYSVYHNNRRQGQTNEKGMNWDMWRKAAEFWSIISSGGAESIRKAVAAVPGEDGEGDPATPAERQTIILKAWGLFSTGDKIDHLKLKPKTRTDDHGVEQLDEFPLVGGIDYVADDDDDKPAKPSGKKPKSSATDAAVNGEALTPEQKAEERRKRAEEVSAKLKERFGGAGEKVTIPGAQSSPNGTKFDFTKKPGPSLIKNKEGLDVQVGMCYRIPGVEGVQWKVMEFYPDEKNGVAMAKLSKKGQPATTSNVAIDNLMPGEKPKPDKLSRPPLKPGNASK